MSDAMDRPTFDHLVVLAALELDENQASYLHRELNHQLNAIRELEAIPLGDDIPITSHGVPFTAEISPPLRQDEWQPYADPAAIVGQAPESEGGYYVVADIPHTTLE